jgi:ribosomal protein S20
MGHFSLHKKKCVYIYMSNMSTFVKAFAAAWRSNKLSPGAVSGKDLGVDELAISMRKFVVSVGRALDLHGDDSSAGVLHVLAFMFPGDPSLIEDFHTLLKDGGNFKISKALLKETAAALKEGNGAAVSPDGNEFVATATLYIADDIIATNKGKRMGARDVSQAVKGWVYEHSAFF